MRQDRVEFRTSDSERRQLEEAAEIPKKHDSMILSNNDRNAFLAALDNPPEPSNELKKAYREYKRRVKR